MDRVDLVTGLALVVLIILAGILENMFQSAGLTTLSAFVWPVGYGTAIITAWYIWFSPLDFQAPDSSEETVWETETVDAQERSAEGE
ncbi:hypothetical protein ACFQMA_11795 [Halosimplex aquaticum]|uniref:Uncharacterized protein n=1 Tax=Halosimplex aquaticum TaxID=3026162 RepID=A0ABD5XZI9_9EURY|nr:hypothetical protein [Halosimplex aquaticum]